MSGGAPPGRRDGASNSGNHNTPAAAFLGVSVSWWACAERVTVRAEEPRRETPEERHPASLLSRCARVTSKAAGTGRPQGIPSSVRLPSFGRRGCLPQPALRRYLQRAGASEESPPASGQSDCRSESSGTEGTRWSERCLPPRGSLLAPDFCLLPPPTLLFSALFRRGPQEPLAARLSRRRAAPPAWVSAADPLPRQENSWLSRVLEAAAARSYWCSPAPFAVPSLTCFLCYYRHSTPCGCACV